MEIEGLFDTNEVLKICALELSERVKRFRFVNAFIISKEDFICATQEEMDSDKVDSSFATWNAGIGKSKYTKFKTDIYEIIFNAPEKTLKAGDWIHYLNKVL